MAANRRSWLVKEGSNKAKLGLDIPDYRTVFVQGGAEPEHFKVGRSSFTLSILGFSTSVGRYFDAFFHNRSEHSVVIDCSVSVEGGEEAWKDRVEGRKIERKSVDVLSDGSLLMVSLMPLPGEEETSLSITVEVEVRWEEVSGDIVMQISDNRSGLYNVELVNIGEKFVEIGENLAKIGEKLAEVEEKFEQNLEEKLERKLEENLERKLEEKLERKLEEKLERKLEDKLEQKLEEKHGQTLRQMKTLMGAEIAKVKAAGVPECPVCFEKFLPPKKMVQCLVGHKICEECSQAREVLSCPTCKADFMGRDHGMEALIREMIGGD